MNKKLDPLKKRDVVANPCHLHFCLAKLPLKIEYGWLISPQTVGIISNQHPNLKYLLLIKGFPDIYYPYSGNKVHMLTQRATIITKYNNVEQPCHILLFVINVINRLNDDLLIIKKQNTNQTNACI